MSTFFSFLFAGWGAVVATPLLILVVLSALLWLATRGSQELR